MNLKTGKQIKPERVQVCIYKLDKKKRGRLPYLPARYCPFCGEHYKGQEPSSPEEGEASEVDIVG